MKSWRWLRRIGSWVLAAFATWVLLLPAAAQKPSPRWIEDRGFDMAETFWNSSGNTDWGTAANWTGGVPGAGDVAIFDGRSNVSVAGSDESAGGTLTRIRIHRKYTGDIGSTGTPLKIPVNYVDHLGHGSVCIELSSATTPYIIVDSGHPLSGYAMRWTGSPPAYLDVLRGRVMAQTIGATGYGIVGGQLDLPGIAGESSNTGEILQLGGVVNCDRAMGRIIQTGGSMVLSGVPADGGVNYFNQFGGIATVETDIAMLLVQILAGTFDISPCTSGFSLTLVQVYPGAEFIFNQESYSGVTTVRDLRNDFP